ncbi:MAG: UDP-2,3-diacylglucosamine diphosphatase [Legionellales bacterium]|nr:UDP-2,3-diacylglucosamine diphosphatase [Legionellales bacterium]
MYSLFIADLHLAEHRPQLVTKFNYLLNHWVSDADALYILGDFFDYWIGDDAASPFQQQIAQQLHHASQTTPIYFMVGNRDFLLGEQFTRQANCHLLTDPYVVDLYHQRVLLKHGDDLCSDDRLHQWFRRVSRQRWIRKIFLALPVTTRQRIAQRIRQQSAQRQLSDQIADVTASQVQAVMRNHQVDHLIHGHTHRPSIEFIQPAAHLQTRTVLSDWGIQGNALLVNAKGEQRLIYF